VFVATGENVFFGPRLVITGRPGAATPMGMTRAVCADRWLAFRPHGCRGCIDYVSGLGVVDTPFGRVS